MSNENRKENKKPRRSFSVIFRILQLGLALLFVFFMSFFITLTIKTSHPIDFIKAAYFSNESTDKIIDDYEKEKKSSSHSTKNITDNIESKEKYENKDYKSTDKTEDSKDKFKIDSSAKKIDASTLSGKIERAQNIRQAVNEKIQSREHYLTLDEIPSSLKQAIVAVEDSRFYKHDGFDLSSIARATVVNVEAGQIEEGASTITQQLVKNLFLSQEQSFTRKAEELILSISMERNFTKDEILELYLNTIYFGSSFYGVYDAAVGYFGVEPKDLTLAESAMLAGLPNAPSLYSPYVDFMLAKKRQLIVIDAMVKANILTDREAEKARIETITLAQD